MASFQTQQQQQQQQQNPFGEDLFKDLTLLDQPIPTTTAPPVRAPARTGTMPVGAHRPSRSTTEEDEARRRRAPPRPRAPPADGLDIFSSPPKTESRRPRRNSESSIIDTRKAADDDARRRERRKEREARREKDGKSKDGKSSRTKKPQGLDLIDKLDVTGIYGQGLFHHDGPFDACNPHRNRKKDYRAPMQAFPVGSANNVLGGSGPVNANVDLDRFHGRGQEGFNDFATSGAKAAQKQTESFNAKQNIEPVHGEESFGLGTSTFLEGAPAPKRSVQPGESDDDELPAMQGPGLGRKKSLAVRLRGLSAPRRTDSDRIVSPDARYTPQSPGPGVQSAGGISKARYGPSQEANPFFNDYDDAYEKKGSQIRIAEGTNRPRAPSSPRPVGLTRSITTESDGYGQEKTSGGGGGGGGGFLNRMKSLKGGRRPRPERRVS